MRSTSFSLGLFAAIAVLTGCGFVANEDIDGPYRLVAVDVMDQMNVCYGLGDGNCIERIPRTVFAVGWDNSYIVAARHPENDKSKVEYFYIDRAVDGLHVDPPTAVKGPFDSYSFEQERQRLALPALRPPLPPLPSPTALPGPHSP